MDKRTRIHCLDYSEPALRRVAEFLIDHSPDLPDLSGISLVVRDSDIAPAFRRALLDVGAQRGVTALLGTTIQSLAEWLQPFYNTTQRPCSEQDRLLVLVEALQNSRLLGQANPWNLAESLLRLFDELTLNHVRISDDPGEFESRLAGLYQISGTPPAGLQFEAQLIHQLWHAWHEQLHAQNMLDPVTAQLSAMQNALTKLDTFKQIHFIGIEPVYRSQIDWLNQCLAQPDVHLWWQGIPDPSASLVNTALDELYAAVEMTRDKPSPATAYHQTLSRMFDDSEPLLDRAKQCAQQFPNSALQDRIRIFSASHAEHEAHAIEFQIRRWLHEGKQSIGVVTENRLQARRLRALLERAGINLQDTTGWALSTTRAAATLESLLLCIEEDFQKDALLDLLKSPFLLPGDEIESRMQLVYRLEHDIIRNESITASLQRYQSALQHRYDRLHELWQVSPQPLIDLLNKLNNATHELRHTCLNQRQRLSVCLSAFNEALNELGLTDSLSNDAAGYQILQILDEMKTAATKQDLLMNWSGFRSWLGRNLEQHYFTPTETGSPVQLFNLAQSAFHQFDAIVIANLEIDSCPGTMPITPFFNSTVRKQLQLPDNQQFRASRLRHFHRLLHSADDILLTHRREQDAELIIASPWLSAIQGFHKLAYQNDLQDNTLAAMLLNPDAVMITDSDPILPEQQVRPAPVVQPDMLDNTFSASSYQQLLDCPYQFYAARYLKLSAPEEIRELLSKREFGERIHQCLQAFHSNVSSLPGPFEQPVTEHNRAEAITLMQQIAKQVFADDIADNYLHRGWYHIWLGIIPDYVEWQIRQQQSSRVSATEVEMEQPLGESLHIKGRIDRIDTSANTPGQILIDYKTGQIPTKKEISAAEKIQLPFYALLCTEQTKVERVFYLPVGRAGEVEEKFPVAEDTLRTLSHDIAQRLLDIVTQIHNGQTLPAWENPDVCRYCDMINLCRCGTWQ